jgi:alkylresorcinol/alkylpyrone synthase
MGWRIDPVGFSAIFSRSIPDLITGKLRPTADAFLARIGVGRESVADYVFHPGGAKVVNALEAVFDLPQGTLNKERQVLREYGNMSAPTALFVLRDALDAGLSGRTFMSALGPGFTASFVTLLG